ncbi:MAG TPA: DUF433 domain-containing protein [Micropepsaceae bacterium]|nr:DUF433 domain-containing protein [Micropepsaceae bacterium]
MIRDSHGAFVLSCLLNQMSDMSPLLKRVSVDPQVCGGMPCIRGTRIWVALILDHLADGMSESELLSEYPELSPPDIRAAIAYGAEAAREQVVEIPRSGHSETEN